MPKIAHYPGCSMHSTAREYNQSLLLVLERLGITYEEVPDWNCCGADSAGTLDSQLAVTLAVRNLVQAKQVSNKVLVPCTHCYERLIKGQEQIEKNPRVRQDVAVEIGQELDHLPRVEHALEILTTVTILDKIQNYAKKSLSGLKVVPYYGCLFAKTPQLSHFDEPDNPQTLDRLIQAIGGEALPWPYKTECCGGSLSLTRPDVAEKKVGRIVSVAREWGADCMVTVCPLCHANLDLRQTQLLTRKSEREIPVFYFSQLIGLALGFDPEILGLRRHFVSPGSALVIAGIHF